MDLLHRINRTKDRWDLFWAVLYVADEISGGGIARAIVRPIRNATTNPRPEKIQVRSERGRPVR